MINHETRKRRRRNELVWTQPRTIPPDVHMNNRPVGTGQTQNSKSVPPDPAQRGQANQAREKPQQGHDPNGAARDTFSRPNVTTWDSDTLLAHLDSSSVVLDNFCMPDLMQTQTQSPTPSKASSTLLPQNMVTSDSTLGPCMCLDEIEGHEGLGLIDEKTDSASTLGGNHIYHDHNEGVSTRKESTASESIGMDLSNTSRLTVDLGANTSRNFRGYNAVHIAAYCGKHSILRVLLLASPDRLTYVNAINDDGKSALHIGAGQGHVEVVRELLSFGAKSVFQDNDGETALHAATAAGSLLTVQLLLDRDLDGRLAHIADAAGHTPLHRAVMQGNEDVVRLLLRKGADLTTMVG
ncbi:hypothetical protein SCUP515_13261 [Seiridium cupressi]